MFYIFCNSELYSLHTERHRVASVPAAILVVLTDVSLTPNVFMIDQYIYF